jgi:hypothetical protein
MREINNYNEYTAALIRIVDLLKVDLLSPKEEYEKEILFQAIEQYSSIRNN